MVAVAKSQSFLPEQRDAIPDQYVATLADREAQQLVQGRYQPQSASRARLERNWITNLSYVLGHQWVYWDPGAWALVTGGAHDERWQVPGHAQHDAPQVDAGACVHDELPTEVPGISEHHRP